MLNMLLAKVIQLIPETVDITQTCFAERRHQGKDVGDGLIGDENLKSTQDTTKVGLYGGDDIEDRALGIIGT